MNGPAPKDDTVCPQGGRQDRAGGSRETQAPSVLFFYNESILTLDV